MSNQFKTAIDGKVSDIKAERRAWLERFEDKADDLRSKWYKLMTDPKNGDKRITIRQNPAKTMTLIFLNTGYWVNVVIHVPCHTSVYEGYKLACQIDRFNKTYGEKFWGQMRMLETIKGWHNPADGVDFRRDTFSRHICDIRNIEAFRRTMQFFVLNEKR